MDHFTIVAPNGLATAQFLGLPALCCGFAVLVHWKFARSTPLLLLKAVLLVVAVFQLRMYFHARHSEVVFVGDRMQFKVPSYYDRSVDLHDVDFKAIRSVNLNQTPDLQPKLRTDGIALIGYRLGWHRLNNGHNAWVAITDPERVVVIPVYDGPTVLVSVEDPVSFVQYLLSLFDTSDSLDDAEGT